MLINFLNYRLYIGFVMYVVVMDKSRMTRVISYSVLFSTSNGSLGRPVLRDTKDHSVDRRYIPLEMYCAKGSPLHVII